MIELERAAAIIEPLDESQARDLRACKTAAEAVASIQAWRNGYRCRGAMTEQQLRRLAPLNGIVAELTVLPAPIAPAWDRLEGAIADLEREGTYVLPPEVYLAASDAALALDDRQHQRDLAGAMMRLDTATLAALPADVLLLVALLRASRELRRD